MARSGTNSYAPPVDQLLAYGELQFSIPICFWKPVRLMGEAFPAANSALYGAIPKISVPACYL